MSKNEGKKFEEDFIKSVPDRCDVTRLKDAGGWSDATNMRFTSSNPCDFIIYSHEGYSNSDIPAMYKFELKSLKGKSLPFGNIKPDYEKMIKFIKALYESEQKGVVAGFVVNFRDVNETYFVESSRVLEFVESTDRKSIPLQWFKEFGYKIKQSLIRVRWRFDLEWL